jgi:hypothetical protein
VLAGRMAILRPIARGKPGREIEKGEDRQFRYGRQREACILRCP